MTTATRPRGRSAIPQTGRRDANPVRETAAPPAPGQLAARSPDANPVRNLENPETPLSTPAQWLVDLFGGGNTAAGVPINERNALEYSPIWQGVRVISETLAQLPLNLIETTDRTDGGTGSVRRNATEHPAWDLLNHRPNEFQTGYSFRELMATHVVSWGNAYAFIEPDMAGRPRNLLPLLPDRTRPYRRKGQVRYRTMVSGQPVDVPAERIIHIAGLGWDGLRGYSPLHMHRRSLGLAVAAEEFGARFFGNDARPGTVIEVPAALGDKAQEKLEASVKKKLGGVDKSWSTMILEEGVKVHTVGIPPEDAQFLETRRFQISDAARILNVPPHMLMELSNAHFNNLEEMSIYFVVYCMQPWFRRFEDAYALKFLSERERRALQWKHKPAGLLRGNAKARAEFYRQLISWGIMTPNEARELEDLNPLDGLDQPILPANYVVADQLGNQPRPRPDEVRVLDMRGCFVPTTTPPEPAPTQEGPTDDADQD